MKQKFKRLLSAILSIVLVIGGLQVSGWTSKATTASAADPLNANYIYLDPTGMTLNGNANWTSASQLYLSVSTEGGSLKNSNGTVTINDKKLFYWDMTGWDKPSATLAMLFTGNWNDTKSNDYYRTNNAPVDFNTAKGKVFKYSGSTSTIDNHTVYNLTDDTASYTGSTPTPTPGTSKTIYFDTTAYLRNDGTGWNAAYIYLYNDNTTFGPVQMTPVAGQSGVFSYSVSSDYTTVIFRPNAGNWSGQTADLTIPSDKNKFTCTNFDTVTSGTWSYVDDSGNSPDGKFPSKVTGTATFFDLYTDYEVTKNTQGIAAANSLYNDVYTNPQSPTSILRAFDKNVNKAISDYWEAKNTGVIPLYFNMYQPWEYRDKSGNDWWNSVNLSGKNSAQDYNNAIKDTGDGLQNFSWFVNRCLSLGDSNEGGAVVQGLVSDELTNGNITAVGTTIVLPQFNPDFYRDNSTIGKMYSPVEFPFREYVAGDGAKYYQFDSGVQGSDYRDIVRMNGEGTALSYYDGRTQSGQIVNGITATGDPTPGFFPFNVPTDSVTEKTDYNNVANKLNYGFGMKLEIQFTMDENGQVKKVDGSDTVPAMFSFSGDDDVWVYVDGKLALDLGGAHGVATGTINFGNLANPDGEGKRYITSTVDYVKGAYKNVGNDWVETTVLSEILATENSLGDASIINFKHGDNEYRGLVQSPQTKTTEFDVNKSIHTLTIFYEERGMAESNFKATFNLEQPTQLKITNKVNVDNINPALQLATSQIAAADQFTYLLKNNGGDTLASGKEYTNQAGTSGLKVDEYGKLVINNNESATFTQQFDRQEVLSLVQSDELKSTYKTSWTFSEMDANGGITNPIAASYLGNKTPYTVSDGRVENNPNDKFKLENKDDGTDESVPARVLAAYVQNPLTGNISIKKTLEEGFTAEGFFTFRVKFNKLFGSTSADVLNSINNDNNGAKLNYNVYDADDNLVARRVATNGAIQIQANQRAEITNIPVDSTYEITEDTDPTYQLVDISSKENNNDKDISTSGKVTGTVVADPNNEDGTITYDLFTFKNGEVRTSDAFLVELDKKNTVAVVPDENVDGTLSGDLKDIAQAYKKATDDGKNVKIVFVKVENGKDVLVTDESGKPTESYTTDGVTYTAGTDGNGKPIITFKPTSTATEGKNTVTVKYQLVEVDENGTIKTTTTEVDNGEGHLTTVTTNNIITPVITATNYLYKANDDIYVLDYGLNVNLADTATNDGLFQNDTLANPSLTGTISTYWNTATGTSIEKATAPTTMEKNTKPAPGEYGTITPAAADSTGFAISNQSSTTEAVNPTVTYSLKKFLANKDYFHYNVLVKKGGATKDTQTSNRYRVNLTSNVTIMPASVVYYEDNFNAGTISTGSTVKIVYTGTYTTGNAPTLLQSNGQSEQYGHDEAYSKYYNNNGDSAGSITTLTADRYNTTASFRFTGTGFDIIARTTGNSGAIYCIVEKVGEKDGEEKLTPTKAIGVDTYYANGNLYQIPVIHENNLKYDTYNVTLGIKANQDGTKTDVFLDGIRIYNPLGTSGDSAYIDNEEGATVTRVSDLIVGDGVITEKGITNPQGDTIKYQDIPGASAALLTYDDEDRKLSPMGASRVEDVEGSSGKGKSSILTYLNAGPTNETYLDDGAALAFVATETKREGVSEEKQSDYRTIQIEAKLLSPSQLNPASLSLRYLDGEKNAIEIETVSSSTAMYYEVPVEKCISLGTTATGEKEYLVVILGNTRSGKTALSFSNVKSNGYTLSNPLNNSNAEKVKNYISKEVAGDNLFVSITPTDYVESKVWHFGEWTVTVAKDELDHDNPEFRMYYVKANGQKTAIKVIAEYVETTDSGDVYSLSFKAPNATGQFPVQLHAIDDDGKESKEYIQTIMKVW